MTIEELDAMTSKAAEYARRGDEAAIMAYVEELRAQGVEEEYLDMVGYYSEAAALTAQINDRE